MLTIKTINQVHTMRHVKSYRSCATSTGLTTRGIDQGRMFQAEVARCNRERRRCWLADSWKNRSGCCR